MKALISSLIIVLSYSWGAAWLPAQGECDRILYNYPTLTGSHEGILEQGRDIIQTSTGELVMVGYAEVLPYGGEQITLVKTDLAGNCLFTRHLGVALIATFGPLDCQGYSVVESPVDGGYLILGDFEQVLIVYKFDVNGNWVWDKRYSFNGLQLPGKMIPTSDGNYLIVSSLQDPVSESLDMHALKIDENGGVLWQVSFGGSADELAESVIELPTGSFAVVGTKDTGEEQDVLLTILTGSGGVQNSFVFGTPGVSETGVDIELGPQGSLLVLGERKASEGDTDILLFKTDPAGNTNARVLGQSGASEYAADLLRLDNGTYMIAGKVEMAGAGLTTSENGYLLRLDAQGNLVGTNTFGTWEGREGFQAIAAGSEGEFYLYGEIEEEDRIGAMDHFLVKADQAGQSTCCGLGPVGQQTAIPALPRVTYPVASGLTLNTYGHFWLTTEDDAGFLPLCFTKAGSETPGLETPGLEAPGLKVFPNPALDHFSVEIPEGYLQERLQISNSMGQVVYSCAVEERECRIDLRGWTKGIYFVQVRKGLEVECLRVVVR